ncbi:hypothetical protein SDC9_169593 [bioreactor metagenome]|uniref:Cupin type-2 domain-containing protein n=1 Tax=bioreactor metagenome TaxID=1076179 RepID=A0A645G893_9ZZZZ
MHTHEADSEIMYIISGKGKLINGDSDTPENAAPGTCHYCPKGCSHSLINDGETELVFFAVIPGRK